ncbi:hypothetical protein NL676_010888 [Syzygium grande]|nr:hypothetical protein NL676_010888 [Syzygium grande]
MDKDLAARAELPTKSEACGLRAGQELGGIWTNLAASSSGPEGFRMQGRRWEGFSGRRMEKMGGFWGDF